MLLDVFGLVAGLDDPGFRGNGGGARSGSELSHLRFPKCDISLIETYPVSLPLLDLLFRLRHRHQRLEEESAYIGTEARPEPETEG